MAWDSLCKVDDLSKLLTVDNLDGIHVKKFKDRDNPFLDFIKEDLKTVYTNFTITKNVDKTFSSLIDIVKKYKLYFMFGIIKHEWLNSHLLLYLHFLHPDAEVQLMPCNRYSIENKKGVTVIAKTELKAKTQLMCLFAEYRKITLDEETVLAFMKKDFSIVRSTTNNNVNIFLGTLSFINHDCNPNCKYLSKSKNLAIIETKRKIMKGEELFVDYAGDYFGDQNQYCECDTCKKKNSKYEILYNLLLIVELQSFVL